MDQKPLEILVENKVKVDSRVVARGLSKEGDVKGVRTETSKNSISVAVFEEGTIIQTVRGQTSESEDDTHEVARELISYLNKNEKIWRPTHLKKKRALILRRQN